jgi:hypothetical protein
MLLPFLQQYSHFETPSRSVRDVEGVPCPWCTGERGLSPLCALNIRLHLLHLFHPILRTFFERKGLAKEAMNWLNGFIESHSHLNR